MATIAIYNLKGGVGKTTLSVNLAWCAATRSSRRTLLWDLDPQAASSWLLSRRPATKDAQSLFSRDVPLASRAVATAWPRLDLIAADASLRGLDRLFQDLDKKKRLAKLLSGLKGYERVILDCPPGLTDTSDQVMRAADVIVVPVIPSPLSERAFAGVKAHLGNRTALMPVHVMVDRRRKVHAEAIARHPDWPVIPMASVIEEMTTRREPVGAFAPRSVAALAFDTLWRVVERQLSA